MAILQALLAALTRSAGRLLNTAFGWATTMIFGKVPESRQIYLSVMAFGSVVWILVVAGIAFPKLGTFLLTFVPLPESVSPNVIRLVMLGAAVALPPILGAVSLLLKDPDERPAGAGAKAKAVLKGYPFTLGLALTLVLMIVFAPILKLRALAHRWTSQHLPMMVEAHDYDAVIGEVHDQLGRAGWELHREPASWMLRFPTEVLTFIAGGSVESLVAERLTTLRAPELEVTLHPADLVVQGKEADVVHARATLAERLAFSRAHLTWTEEGNELEDRIRSIHRDLEGEPADGSTLLGRLAWVDQELRRLELSYEEWEVLFRARSLVELAARRRGAAASGAPAGWFERTLVPLGVAAAAGALESPRVRARLETLALGVLDRLEEHARVTLDGVRRTERAGGDAAGR
jgi:hypothetical protein